MLPSVISFLHGLKYQRSQLGLEPKRAQYHGTQARIMTVGKSYVARPCDSASYFYFKSGLSPEPSRVPSLPGFFPRFFEKILRSMDLKFDPWP